MVWCLNFSNNEVHTDTADFEFAKRYISAPNDYDFRDEVYFL